VDGNIKLMLDVDDESMNLEAGRIDRKMSSELQHCLKNSRRFFFLFSLCDELLHEFFRSQML
jgi:hypothetical protein